MDRVPTNIGPMGAVAWNERGGRRALVAASLAALLAACGAEEPPPDAAPPDLPAAQLDALGYLDWAEARDPHLEGTTRLEPEADDDALFLFASGHAAWLIDRRGERVHGWEGPAEGGSWHHVELGPGGDLFVVGKRDLLARLAWDGTARWSVPLPVHHDLDFAPDGTLWTLASRLRDVPVGERSAEILDDELLQVAPATGEVLREISLFDRIGHRLGPKTLRHVADWVDRGRPHGTGADSRQDVFHTNSIQVVDWPGAPPGRAVLLSVRELGRIFVLSLDADEILFEWGEGELDAAHHATRLPDGRILLFDNGYARGWSRILAVDPKDASFETLYAAEGFHSARRGAVERGPDGRLLVTESDAGRVFEVDAAGRLLWEYRGPVRRAGGDGRPERAAFYRVERIDRGALPPGAVVGD